MIPITPERAKSLIENARKAGVPEEELQEMIKSYEEMTWGEFPRGKVV